MFKSLKRKAPAEAILYYFVSLIFAIVAASYVYIVVWTLISSLKTHQEIVLNPFSLPAEWKWSNYLDMVNLFEINGNGFWDMLFNSVWFSVVGSLLGTLTTVRFAYTCTRYRFPGSNLIYPIILIMMTLPIYGSSGATYKIIYNMGMVDSYAHVLLSIAGMSSTFLYYRAFIQSISRTYDEAAMMDGANDFQIYWKIMMPQLRPIITAFFVTTWLAAWNNYSSALVYLPKLPTLPVGIYQFNVEMLYRVRLDVLFAACIIVSIPALILFIAFNKVITTSVSLGGIKE